ncbi:hypothetical protein TCON_2622 [Astathelohania contejeani]|uniref:Uncharacterized protein n=1 Tax=Astathelohania contejeani TaxID=164912 RepID=A0ABQ7HVI1_9MICR|nr:hypothetical protein TCON_2622 [Thelohania contejeani]
MGKKKIIPTKTSEENNDVITVTPPSEVINKKQSHKRKPAKELYQSSLMIINNQNQDDEKYLITYNPAKKKMKSADDIVKKLNETFQVFKESQKKNSKYNIIPIKEKNKPIDRGECICIMFQKPITPTKSVPEILVTIPDDDDKQDKENPLEASQGLDRQDISPPTAAVHQSLLSPLPSTSSAEKVVFTSPPASPSP